MQKRTRINKEKFKQYFTPVRVAEFMQDMVLLLDGNIGGQPVTFIDPACGEGVFIQTALERGLTKPELCRGYDRDAALRQQWESLPAGVNERLITADSLFVSENLHFRLAMGNPPYGVLPLENDKFEQYWDYELFRIMNSSNKRSAESNISVPEAYRRRGGGTPPVPVKQALRNDEKKPNLTSFPVEVFFLEKFVRLLEPGGIAAIVLPQGIFTNEKMAFIRRWLLEQVTVQAIVFLQKKVFTAEGAAANTALLFVRKEKSSAGSRVFWASVTDIDLEESRDDHLDEVTGAFRSGEQQVRDDFLAFFTGVDILHESRWDPEFNHPRYDELFLKLESGKHPIKPLSLLISPENIITGYKGPQESAVTENKIPFITSRHVFPEGIDMSLTPSFIDAGSKPDSPRSRLRIGDVLLVRSGEGCIGRTAVVDKRWEGANIRSEIYVLRFDNRIINPYYLSLFLQCFKVPFNSGRSHKKHMAHFQVARFANGVGTPNLNKQEILSLRIPIIPREKQDEAEREFRRIKGTRKREKVENLIERLEKIVGGVFNPDTL